MLRHNQSVAETMVHGVINFYICSFIFSFTHLIINKFIHQFLKTTPHLHILACLGSAPNYRDKRFDEKAKAKHQMHVELCKWSLNTE